MLRDVLRDTYCPRCGGGGAELERLARRTLVVPCEARHWHALDLWYVSCNLCAHIWLLVAQGQQVTEATALRALR